MIQKYDTNSPRPASSVKALLRDDERFCVIKTDRHFAVSEVSDIGRPELEYVIEHIDALTGSGRLLKNGNTCFVSVVTLSGGEYVIKRYNPKGFLHSIRHTLKRSRARRGWLNAHRLLRLGVPTPRAVGFIEEYGGILLRRSWLITELAKGPKLRDYLADPEVSKAQKKDVIDKVFVVLSLLEQHRMTHGDLKHVNLIVTRDGPTLLDLDSLKTHKTGLFYLYHRKKDLDAFNFAW